MQTRRPAWLAVDVLCVLIFSALGRRSHAEGLSISGILTTAWPFLSGTLIGWLLSRAWKRPCAVAPTGVTVWISTLVVGMILRKLTSAVVVPSFVAVAGTFTGLFLVGWRGVFALIASRASR